MMFNIVLPAIVILGGGYVLYRLDMPKMIYVLLAISPLIYALLMYVFGNEALGIKGNCSGLDILMLEGRKCGVRGVAGAYACAFAVILQMLKKRPNGGKSAERGDVP
ncbi:MAG: hypothetical protein ACK4E7_09830 [Permianibacter sp.]